MKIYYVSISAIPSRTANSVHVMKMCQAMTQGGHDVVLCAPKLPGMKPFADDALWHHYGIVDRFPIRWIDQSPRLKGYDYAWRAVRAAIASRADLVYTRHAPAASLASLSGLKTICEIHTPPSGLVGPALFASYLRLSGRRRVVVITDALRRWLNGKLPAHMRGLDIVVAHDGIDLERFADLPGPVEARQALGLKDAFTVAYAGHLYPGRGIEQLLDLAASLPMVEFLFIGGEPKSVEARRREVAMRKLSNANFVGFVANAELPRHLAAADALLMPYQRQVAVSGGGDTSAFMSPLKMFEYLATGRLIISSDLPVLREVLDESVAILCPPDDLDQWQAAIVKVAGDPTWRQQQAERGRLLVEQYSWRERTRRCLSGLSGLVSTL